MMSGMYNFHKYENMLKKESEFLKELEKICTELSIDRAIRVLKLSGIVVNPFNNNKYEKLLKKSYDIISNFVKNDSDKLALEKLINDKKKIEDLYDKVNNLREKKIAELLSNSKYEKNTYLINLELTIRSFNEWINKGEVFKKVDTPEFPQAQIDMYEHILENSSNVFKYFDYKNYEQKNVSRNFNEDALKMAQEHIKLNTYWQEIDYIHDYWKYADLNIDFDENEQLKVDFFNDDLDLRISISDRRYKNFDTSQQMNIQNELNFQKQLTQDTLFKSISRRYFESFFINPSKAYSKNISVSKWLEAYELLQKECDEKIRKGYSQLSMKNTLLVKTKYDWLKFFIKNGFSREESQKIINQFTFHSKSTDFVDYPFIEFGDYLVVLPSITINSIGGKAISSNFLSERVQLDFRGHEFESNIIDLLKKSNVSATGLHYKDDNGEYECDVAFCLDQDIYLVECKAHIQPVKLRQHVNHLHKIEDYVKQLDRIAKFYTENPQLIKEKLSLNDDFAIKNIYKIVLTTSMQGSDQTYGDTFVVDNSSFSSMILRRNPSLKMSSPKEVIEYYSEEYACYQGNITSEKMLNFLECPPQIHITKKFFEKTEGRSFLGKFIKYTSRIPLMEFSKESHPSENHLKILNP